jgi:hypothetical protein
MNKILIVHLCIGPTYKNRLINNLKTYPGYNNYDVFILTNDVNYFHSIAHMENVFLQDMDEIRKDYPWSIELEPVPKEKTDQTKYAEEIWGDSIFKFPTLVERFVFLWDKVTNYDGFVFMNCDVIPLVNSEQHKVMEDYFSNPLIKYPQQELWYLKNELGELDDTLKDKIVVIPGGFAYGDPDQPFLKDDAIDINNKYKITDREIKGKFISTDGNFTTIKFPNKSMMMPFFELLNNICYDILVDKKYFMMSTAPSWNLHAEFILSIAFKLFDSVAFPLSFGSGIVSNVTFRIDCYPEDRFWNFSGGFINSDISKEDFIEKNYDELKRFYENRGQIWPY